MKYLFLLPFFLCSIVVDGQSKCSDINCIFSPLNMENYGVDHKYWSASPRDGFSAALFLPLAITNEYHGKENFVKIWINKDGYWKEIGKIYLCDWANHMDEKIYLNNRYKYARSKGNDKPKKISLTDMSKQWKAD